MAQEETGSNSTYSPFSADTGNVLFVASFIELKSLDTGACLDRGSCIVAAGIRVVELVVFQVMGPYREATIAHRSSYKVMARILHDETQIQVPCEVDSKLDLRDCADIDNVLVND